MIKIEKGMVDRIREMRIDENDDQYRGGDDLK